MSCQVLVASVRIAGDPLDTRGISGKQFVDHLVDRDQVSILPRSSAPGASRASMSTSAAPSDHQIIDTPNVVLYSRTRLRRSSRCLPGSRPAALADEEPQLITRYSMLIVCCPKERFRGRRRRHISRAPRVLGDRSRVADAARPFRHVGFRASQPGSVCGARTATSSLVSSIRIPVSITSDHHGGPLWSAGDQPLPTPAALEIGGGRGAAGRRRGLRPARPHRPGPGRVPGAGTAACGAGKRELAVLLVGVPRDSRNRRRPAALEASGLASGYRTANNFRSWPLRRHPPVTHRWEERRQGHESADGAILEQ